jgi:hypothetical protein
MRPKIKDFAEHCDFYIGNEHYDKSYEEKQVLWLEKFAEMIIDECIQVTLNAKSKEAAAMLVTHFGGDIE